MVSGRPRGEVRRVRMTRETGQALVLSCAGEGARLIEVRVSQVCANGTAILEVVTDAASAVTVTKGEECGRGLAR